MYNLFSDLRGFSIQTTDGTKGTVDDIYFDDDAWIVRYLVADIGSIILGRKALLSQTVLREPDLEERTWPVELSSADVEQAPPPDAEPVSAKHERRIGESSGALPSLLLSPEGAALTPFLAEQLISRHQPVQELASDKGTISGNPHLRSMLEVTESTVRASDGSIGTIEDFLVNPLDWRVRYIVVDTGRWLPGKSVVLSTACVSGVDWEKGRVTVDLTKHKIETSPEPTEISRLRRSDEDAFIAHYGVPPL
jgi:uncharacterized protein YrrD